MAEFGKLPGIGARTAERLAFHVLKSPKDEALALAEAIRDVKTRIHPCRRCYNPTEGELCGVCSDARRDGGVICVVEQPKDLLAIESTGSYDGVYHVLMGHIAPLENVSADDLTIEALIKRVKAGWADKPTPGAVKVREIVMATNPNVAGDGTALYIASQLEPFRCGGLKITRLARGLPAGGAIEYANQSILTDAITDRRDV